MLLFLGPLVRVALRVILYKDILILENDGFFQMDFAHLTVYNLNVVWNVRMSDNDRIVCELGLFPTFAAQICLRGTKKCPGGEIGRRARLRGV